MKHKYKLFKLKSGEDSSNYWEFIVTDTKEINGIGVETLPSVNLKMIIKGFNVNDVFLDIYEYIFSFNNLEELKEVYPEEFI